jgi:phage-related minor tail protein
MSVDLDEALARSAEGLEAAERSARALSSAVGVGLRRALEDAVFGARSLGEALQGVGRGVARDALRAAVAPAQGAITDGIGALVGRAVGALGFAKGAAFDGGAVRAFAKGGIVGGPTYFPMAGGATGLMGEAGPEAIIPLARGADGRLGVRGAGGGGTVNITMNVSTPDADGFRRSGPQIAAELARMVERGRRNL